MESKNSKRKRFIQGWQISVATVGLILGFLLSVQYKSQAEHRKAATIPSRRIEELAKLLQDSEERRDSLEKEVLSLRNEITKVKDKKVDPRNKDKLVLTGFIPLKGPGVSVILNDSKEPLEEGENPANSIIHDEDLLKVTNVLSAAGAEAISVNGNRIISTSEISCAGPTILVNKTRIAPPFEILAIGDSKTMVSALEMRGGIIETLKVFGIQVNIMEKAGITIPAYTGNLDFKYSTPVLSTSDEL